MTTRRTSIALLAALATLSFNGAASTADDAGAAADPEEELSEVTVTAIEPRFVAPTTRDRIGRVWVPVHIDGKGPFRLVLDTGAQRSAVISKVASRLEIPLDRSPPVRLHGATGTSIAPTIKVDMLSVGDVWMRSERLPIVADAFGGADGLLGTDGLQDRRIYIDFRADYVDISRSRNRRAARGFIALPFIDFSNESLLMVNARVGSVDVLAVIDTGAQATVGNEALRDALRRQVARNTRGEEQIHGATGDVQTGIGARVSPIRLGDLQIRDAHVTFGELHIFNLWELTDRPALLVGMDILGLVDTLVIDYRRRELHIKPSRG
jgi:predicted aspartyl protease